MAATTNPFVRIAGIIMLVLGVVFIGTGTAAWLVTSSQLSSENITVPKDADMLAGKRVAGPFTAYAQAEVIKKHLIKGTGGLTYAELGAKAGEAKAAGDTAGEEQYNKQRSTAQAASFLRASLFTSVLAFGISALVAGLGLVQVLIGLVFLKLAKRS